MSVTERGKTSTGWFFGFKLHLVFNERGESLDFLLTAGNVHDVKALPCLARRPWGKLFGDKGYISATLFGELLTEHNVQRITRLKDNMRSKLTPLADKLMLHKRAGLIAYCHQPTKPSFIPEIPRALLSA